MNQGKFVFSQVIEFIPRYRFDKLVKQYKGDWHVKNLTSYNHLLHLLFGQLTGCDSLRDICLCVDAHSKILYHLGFRNTDNHRQRNLCVGLHDHIHKHKTRSMGVGQNLYNINLDNLLETV